MRSLHREGSESCLYGNRGDMWSLALSTESNMLDATGRRLFTSQDPTKQAGPSTMTFREEAGLLALQAQLSLIAQSCPTLCDPMDCSMPGFPVHHQLPELAQTHVHQVGDTIQNISSSVLPFSSCLQSFPASGSFLMSVLHNRWPKYWSFSFSISPSNEYSGLISFRMDWLDLLAVPGALRVFSNTTVQKHQFIGT